MKPKQTEIDRVAKQIYRIIYPVSPVWPWEDASQTIRDGCLKAARWHLRQMRTKSLLREALCLYHEAWNSCEGDWHKAMREASANANYVLWPKEYNADGTEKQQRRRD
jgi:hypothetical protein